MHLGHVVNASKLDHRNFSVDHTQIVHVSNS
jgi:hypothetical protein